MDQFTLSGFWRPLVLPLKMKYRNTTQLVGVVFTMRLMFSDFNRTLYYIYYIRTRRKIMNPKLVGYSCCIISNIKGGISRRRRETGSQKSGNCKTANCQNHISHQLPVMFLTTISLVKQSTETKNTSAYSYIKLH